MRDHGPSHQPAVVTDREAETGNGSPRPAPPQERSTRLARLPAREPQATVPAKEEVTGGDRLGRVVDLFTPPEVWSEQRPALREVVRYASHGAQTGPAGPARTAAKAWAYGVAIPVSATAYVLAWVFERPSRAGAAGVLYVVLAHTGIGSWLPWPTWLP